MGSGREQLAVRMVRTEGSIITAVEGDVEELLGHRPETLIGTPSTRWIHPADQSGALQAWMDMLGAPGAVGRWSGRYRSGSGDWVWIETENRNCLDDPEHPRVETSMRPAAGDFVSIEEALRAREELISRLSEALPVGVLQIDAAGAVILTNDRLREILACTELTSTTELLDLVDGADRDAVERALVAVLGGDPVDDLELRLAHRGDRSRAAARYCRLSVRALTDGAGAVTGAIGCLLDITDSTTLRQELERRATTDHLTGCLNRSGAQRALEAALVDMEQGVAVAFVDLDRFKHVNDVHGHGCGDRVLVAAAERLRRGMRPGDRLGRMGGDEFVVICSGVASAGDADTIGSRLADALNGPFAIDGARIELRGSVGVAWTDTDRDADALVRRADEAMYAAKAAARAQAPASPS